MSSSPHVQPEAGIADAGGAGSTAPSANPARASDDERERSVAAAIDLPEEIPLREERLYVIDLAPLKQMLGARWRVQAPTIQHVVERILRSSLPNLGTFKVVDDQRWFLKYSIYGASVLGRKSFQIAEVIASKLLGDDVERRVADVYLALYDEESDRIYLEELTEETDDAAGGPSDADQDAAVERQRALLLSNSGIITDALAEHEARLRDLLERLLESRLPVRPADLLAALEPRASARASLARVVGEENVDTWLASVGENGACKPMNVVYNYRPLWLAKKNVLSSYVLDLAADTGEGVMAFRDILPQEERRRFHATIDRVAVLQAVTDVLQAMQSGKPSGVVVPVHETTFATGESSADFIDVCAQIPEDLHSYFIWELIGHESTTWNNRIVPIVNRLKSFGRAVVLKTGTDNLRFDDLKAMGVHAVGFDLRDCDLSEREMLAFSQRFAKTATNHGLASCVMGVSSLSMAMSMATAGFSYIEGSIIAEPVTSPTGVASFRMEDVYERKLQVSSL